MLERHIDYTTIRGNEYRIVYHLIGFFLWEWDILLRVNDDKGEWLGLTFGQKRTLFPKREMRTWLHLYAKYKDQ